MKATCLAARMHKFPGIKENLSNIWSSKDVEPIIEEFTEGIKLRTSTVFQYGECIRALDTGMYSSFPNHKSSLFYLFDGFEVFF